MARALLGYVATSASSREQALALEVNRLRRRVAQLEVELADVRASQHELQHDHIDLELHQLAADAAPALA